MSTAIDRFQAGQRNVQRLLDVFSNQLRAFARGRTPDMLLMHDIVDCLNRYAAIGDDAYEGELIDALTQADDRFAPARLVLTTEHEAIIELGERCLALIEDMIGSIVVSRSALLTPARRYLRIYQEHLRRERSYLQRHRHRSTDDTAPDRPYRPLPRDPLEEFTDLCERITQTVEHLETDEFGLSVCAACGSDATSNGNAQTLPLGS
ncbi:hypothetical protein [Nitrococcus mobilis]|uniref:Hemerythrin-like domain-containing protein n=1 Tax=Nitrococcus mobilis Nb-231 TaxID=314278 RepID=A4BST5_9GAMM|nr:hypothetical protein [Nitrococcus mobilis]EAR21179.1 hypothetical protein NB231_00620 [Nitrococcus mobilis Nb-231]